LSAQGKKLRALADDTPTRVMIPREFYLQPAREPYIVLTDVVLTVLGAQTKRLAPLFTDSRCRAELSAENPQTLARADRVPELWTRGPHVLRLSRKDGTTIYEWRSRAEARKAA
jgi:hypothetical protein